MLYEIPLLVYNLENLRTYLLKFEDLVRAQIMPVHVTPGARSYNEKVDCAMQNENMAYCITKPISDPYQDES
ncbi:hypothetical protein TWF703_010835 [Orbilia oligospora]|uniref:Uncharacterized protein n=1 Tax=Orbilia oligospora TaxID=2813651 RepID=A0A7C8JSC6_ORBOL|nr:hypothetical protein TWF703_010835 [Orbilia oligospora]